MKPAHHPSADILTAYAAGALDPGFGLVTAAHIESCPACATRVRCFEVSSGAALASLPDETVGADALSKVMARLDEKPAPALKADARSFLQRLPIKSRTWVAPGVWVAAVDTPHAPDNRVYLLRVGPGAATARHSHSGAEFCTILKGAYRDELGVFSAGDFAAADGALNHQPIVEGDEECICLFATEGRLKPQGWIGRLAFDLAGV